VEHENERHNWLTQSHQEHCHSNSVHVCVCQNLCQWQTLKKPVPETGTSFWHWIENMFYPVPESGTGKKIDARLHVIRTSFSGTGFFSVCHRHYLRLCRQWTTPDSFLTSTLQMNKNNASSYYFCQSLEQQDVQSRDLFIKPQFHSVFIQRKQLEHRQQVSSVATQRPRWQEWICITFAHRILANVAHNAWICNPHAQQRNEYALTTG